MTGFDEVDEVVEVQGDEFVPLYPSLADWVEHHFTQAYLWRVTVDSRWCAQWWEHPEAIVRLNVLWQLWELARVEEDPAAMASWVRDWLDRLLPPLVGVTGPFYGCSVDPQPDGSPWLHKRPPILPTAPAPREFYAAPDSSEPAGPTGPKSASGDPGEVS